MKINTIPGTSYALTCTAACTIQALSADTSIITILEADEAGQYVFVAPTDAVEVSDNHALVTQTSKRAPAGLSAVWSSIKKISASLASKLNVSTFNAHKSDVSVHVKAQERETWNGKQDKLTDTAGNMTLAGKLTARSANLNGPMIVNNPTGNLGNGTHNQIHGVTWFYQQPEFRNGVIIRGDTFLESGVLSISAAASLNCKGPATYGATINANGGINIPMAAGAATDTAAVNRAYALGMAHVVMMHQMRTYWLTASCTATNGVNIIHTVPGFYFEGRINENSHTSLTAKTTWLVGGGDYNKMLGYSLPIRCDGGSPGSWHKVSMLLGAGGQWSECPNGGMDDFRFRPTSGSVPASARLVEVTFYYDSVYKARVRELIGIGSPKSYVVRTTVSGLRYDSNTNPCGSGYRMVIAQSQRSHSDALTASVWLIMGGASDDTVIKLADIRGWDTYHTSVAPVLYLDAQASMHGAMIRMESPTIINGIGGNTYVRYGLEPYQRSWITTETEELYNNPEQPIE